jgi:hypothetical protein
MVSKDNIDPWLISDDHYSAIGRVAASWAALEAMVSSAIWQIGGIQDEIGACVTSQIFTFDGKIKALIPRQDSAVLGGVSGVCIRRA